MVIDIVPVLEITGTTPLYQLAAENQLEVPPFPVHFVPDMSQTLSQ